MINKHMKYTVYQITNTTNGKIYIGCHKTDDLDDGYMGSGLALKRALEKYGAENFEKEYLHIFDTAEEMFEKETELVNESFVARSDTYNIKEGGNGGFDHITPEQIAERNRRIAKNRVIDKQQRIEVIRKIHAQPGHLDRVREGVARYVERNGGGSFTGKKHSPETIAKMSESSKGMLSGKDNPMYGKCWIHNDKQSIRVDKADLESYIADGWIKGRKMKF